MLDGLKAGIPVGDIKLEGQERIGVLLGEVIERFKLSCSTGDVVPYVSGLGKASTS